MNSVAGKENLLKQVIGFALNVFLTRFVYQQTLKYRIFSLSLRVIASLPLVSGTI
jgi:hypothetical protein